MTKQENSVENFAGSRSKNPARTQCHFDYEERRKIWTKEGRAHWQVCFQLLETLSVTQKISSTRSNRS